MSGTAWAWTRPATSEWVGRSNAFVSHVFLEKQFVSKLLRKLMLNFLQPQRSRLVSDRGLTFHSALSLLSCRFYLGPLKVFLYLYEFWVDLSYVLWLLTRFFLDANLLQELFLLSSVALSLLIKCNALQNFCDSLWIWLHSCPVLFRWVVCIRCCNIYQLVILPWSLFEVHISLNLVVNSCVVLKTLRG